MERVFCVCVCVCTCSYAARARQSVSHNPCLFHRKMDVVSWLTEKNGLMKFSRLPQWDKKKRVKKDWKKKKQQGECVRGEGNEMAWLFTAGNDKRRARLGTTEKEQHGKSRKRQRDKANEDKQTDPRERRKWGEIQYLAAIRRKEDERGRKMWGGGRKMHLKRKKVD